MAVKVDNISAIAIVLSIIAIIAVILIAYSKPNPAAGSGPSIISVSASGSASGQPDQAVLRVFANATGKTSADAFTNLSATISALNRTIMPYVNQNSSMIKTSAYSTYRVYNSTMYGASEGLIITLPNIKNTSPAISSLASMGNVYVQYIQPQLSSGQFGSLLDSSLRNAVANATSQAQVVAGSGSISIQNVSVEGSPIYYPIGPLYTAGPAQSLNSSFFSGTATVVRTVYATFSVKR